MKHDITKQLVKQILLRFGSHEWSLQGFGMLRTYLDADKRYRLHVWTGQDRVPDVSDIHTHPWDFESTIIAGKLRNVRYEDYENPEEGTEVFHRQLIKCGVGGCSIGEPELANLYRFSEERYEEGDYYYQEAREIHASYPEDGTVTLIDRTFGTDVDHAHVYFPQGKSWISAEPRPATPNEVRRITELALDKWF